MSLSINSKKIIASVMALSIVASGVISSEASIFSKIVPTNTISAEAATISSGDWEYQEINSYTARLTKYKGNKTNVTIPSYIDNHRVGELGARLFQNSTVTSVTVSNGIEEIPWLCFQNATKLTSVSLPSSLKIIGQQSFQGTTALKSITIPSSVNSIKYDAFYNSGLTSISLQSDIAFEGEEFANCKNLKTVTLSNKIRTISHHMFSGCTSLESITIPSSVTSVQLSAFEGCTKLKSITLPSSVSAIGQFAFKGCTSLKSAALQGSAIGMGTFVFENCTALENINISNASIFGKLIATSSLKGASKLSKINNEQIVTYRCPRYSQLVEPIIKTEYFNELKKYFEIADQDKLSFFEEYLSREVTYIVKSKTNAYMTDGEKIKVLMDWIVDKVDYAFAPDGSPDPSQQCHVDSSVFMRDTTVCEGHARALTLLLNEAGIEAYYLSGDNHAWCMVKLGNRYFHVDACHDDNPRDYDHFLKSDADLKKCTCGHSYWRIQIPNNSRFKYTIPATTPVCQYSVGDANRDRVINKKDVELIQKYLLHTASIPETVLADANLDGHIDMSDTVYLIQRYPECR